MSDIGEGSRSWHQQKEIDALRERIQELDDHRDELVEAYGAALATAEQRIKELEDVRKSDLAEFNALAKERDLLRLDAAIGRVPLDQKDFEWERRLDACEKGRDDYERKWLDALKVPNTVAADLVQADLKMTQADAVSLTERVAELERAIDNEMVVTHLGVFNSGDDPKVAINKLMVWSQELGEYMAMERMKELEAVIKSHGIPIKTAAGGEAHYCTGGPVAYLMETDDAKWLGFEPDYQATDHVTPLHKEKWKVAK